MKIQRIEIQTLVHATEDFEKVLICLKNIIPFEFSYNAQKTLGHFKNPIYILNVALRKRKEIEKFIAALNERLSSEDRKKIKEELEERFEEGKLYMRLDKMRAYAGEAALGEGIQIALTATSYPFNKEKIVAGLGKLFE
jgi:hypothetical protein